MKGEQWASIQDLTIAASPQLAKLEDNLAFIVGFKLKGGIRRNFVRPLWEKAYDEHDLGLRMAYRVDLSKQRAKVLPGAELKREKFRTTRVKTGERTSHSRGEGSRKMGQACFHRARGSDRQDTRCQG